MTGITLPDTAFSKSGNQIEFFQIPGFSPAKIGVSVPTSKKAIKCPRRSVLPVVPPALT